MKRSSGSLRGWASKLVDLCNELNEHIRNIPIDYNDFDKMDSIVNDIKVTPEGINIGFFSRENQIRAYWENRPGVRDYFSGESMDKGILVDKIVDTIEFARKHHIYSDYYRMKYEELRKFHFDM